MLLLQPCEYGFGGFKVSQSTGKTGLAVGLVGCGHAFRIVQGQNNQGLGLFGFNSHQGWSKQGRQRQDKGQQAQAEQEQNSGSAGR